MLLCYSDVSFAMTSLADLGYDEAGGAYPLNMTAWGSDGLAFDYDGDSVMILAGAFAPTSQSPHSSAASLRLAMPRPRE